MTVIYHESLIQMNNKKKLEEYIPLGSNTLSPEQNVDRDPVSSSNLYTTAYFLSLCKTTCNSPNI